MSAGTDTLASYEELGLVKQKPGTVNHFEHCSITLVTGEGKVASGDGAQVDGERGDTVIAQDHSQAAGADASAAGGTVQVDGYGARFRGSGIAIGLAASGVTVVIATTVLLIVGLTTLAIAGYVVGAVALILGVLMPLFR